MGTANSSQIPFDPNGEVNFDHFQILRAIGKGSFGKVCIVQKKDTKKMLAMKYMNKAACARQAAINNVIRELDILARLDHPFLVNLWYAFQDEEDMFMVVDLLLGGDLRYHMQQEVPFTEHCVTLYLCQLALALDYLRTHNIVHRDIKPDNILLDERGYCHVTDFNIATQLGPDELATSMSGTRPYMAPELYGVALNHRKGYSFPVDWWSLGVSLFELLKKRRPFEAHSGSLQDSWLALQANKGHLHVHNISKELKDVFKALLEFEPDDRLCSVSQLKQHSLVADVNFDALLNRELPPPFVPSKEQLNCDPTYELEEMIIETKPLHKKKKRLAKRNSTQSSEGVDKVDAELQSLTRMFRYYNRDKVKSRTSHTEADVRCNSPTTIKCPPHPTLHPRVSNHSNVTDATHHHQQQHQHQRLQEGPTVTAPKENPQSSADAIVSSLLCQGSELRQCQAASPVESPHQCQSGEHPHQASSPGQPLNRASPSGEAPHLASSSGEPPHQASSGEPPHQASSPGEPLQQSGCSGRAGLLQRQQRLSSQRSDDTASQLSTSAPDT